MVLGVQTPSPTLSPLAHNAQGWGAHKWGDEKCLLLPWTVVLFPGLPGPPSPSSRLSCPTKPILPFTMAPHPGPQRKATYTTNAKGTSVANEAAGKDLVSSLRGGWGRLGANNQTLSVLQPHGAPGVAKDTLGPVSPAVVAEAVPSAWNALL